MLSVDPLSLDSAMLDEARAYLRLEGAEEHPSLGAVLLAAIGHAEAYLGQLLVRRIARTTVPASLQWQRHPAFPVTMVTEVTGIPAEGASFVLGPDAYKVDIDYRGEAWLRVPQPGAAGRIEVAVEAGLVPDWSSLPEAIRLAVLRLAAHLHAHRDNPDDIGPPEGVATLLRPWRRTRLS